AARPGADLDLPRSRRCSVGHPGLAAVGSVVGAEEQAAAEREEIAGVGAVAPGRDVRHAGGSLAGAIGDPNLAVGRRVVSGEVEPVARRSYLADERVVERIANPEQLARSAGGAVGRPEN